MADDLKIEVENLRGLRAALKHAGPGLDKKVTELNYEIANHVVDVAKGKANAQGGAAAKAAPSLRASKTAASANIKLGGARYRYAYGAEFGSLRYKQFKKWRGNQWQPWGSDGVGYFLHPAIRSERQYIIDTYATRVSALMAEAFPN
jgi:hypothetical protein